MIFPLCPDYSTRVRPASDKQIQIPVMRIFPDYPTFFRHRSPACNPINGALNLLIIQK